MMPLNLTANEARIIGCLIEKSVITSDQYPLTLNALTNFLVPATPQQLPGY